MNKKDIINRLVKDGAVTFEEALVLMEAETRKETVIIREAVKETPTPKRYWPTWPEHPYWLHQPTCIS